MTDQRELFPVIDQGELTDTLDDLARELARITARLEHLRTVTQRLASSTRRAPETKSRRRIGTEG